MKQKTCEQCGIIFDPDSPAQRWCSACGAVRMREMAQKRARRRYEREKERCRIAREQRRVDHGGK